jgi:hypothetical protein
MDEKDEIVAIRSKISSNSSKIILGLDLYSESVAAMIYLTQNAKSILLLILQLCKFFMRVEPRYYICWIIVFSRFIYRPKIRSGLRSGKRYNKNTTAFKPRRGIILLYLLNQAIIVRASKF